MPKSVPKLWAPKLTNVFGSKTKVTHLGDTEMCDDGPQRDHEEDVNHEPRNSKSLRDGQSLVVPQHAGAPFIAPTRIFVAPKAEAPADAVITMGICLLVEFMMAPADAEEPPQLRAFWSEVGVLTNTPHLGLPQLHDFVFQMFALCMFTPECTVIALMLVIRILSYHPHLRVTSRNCKRLLLCAMMIAQKYWDDTPLRNVDFSVAWGRVQPAERPCPIDRINAMECVFLGALGFDLYIPEVKYVACIDELVSIVRMHERDDVRIPALLRTHIEFLNGPNALRFPWLSVNNIKRAPKKTKSRQ
jgi:hypothetical protein